MRIFVPEIQDEVEFPDDTPIEEVEKSLNQSFGKPDAPLIPTTFKDREAYRLDRGQSVVDNGRAWAKAMRGETKDEDALAFETKRNARFTPENDERFDAKNTTEKFIGAGTELAPYMLSSTVEAIKYGEITGAGAAGVAAAAGAAGPQVALPEEVITVPAAYFMGRSIGQAYGSWMNAYEVEAGSLYGELVKAKVDPQTARAWAAPAGALIGAIELFQVGQVFNKFLPGGMKYSRKGAAEFIKKAAMSKVSDESIQGFLAAGEKLATKTLAPFQKLQAKAAKSAAGRFAAKAAETKAGQVAGSAARIAGGVGTRTAVELAEQETQQAIELFAEAGAHLQRSMTQGTDYAGPTGDEVKAALKDTLVQGLYGFPVLGLPGAAWSEVRGRNRATRALVSEKGLDTLQTDLAPVVEEASKYEDFKTFMDSANITIDEKTVQDLGFDNYPGMMQAAFAASRGMKKDNDLRSKFDEVLDQGDFTEGSEEDVKVIKENLPAVMQAYGEATMKEYGTERPVVSSGDLPKTMHLDFRNPFTSSDSASRHAAASAIAKIFDEERLNDPKTRDADVLVLGGVSGAGKTHVTKKMNLNLDSFALVKDTNLNSLKAAQKIVEKALATGHKVQIVYIERDPIEAFKDGVYRRFQKNKERRVVPIKIHLKNAGARDAALEVAEFYKENPNVEVGVIENRSGQDPKEIALEDLKPLEYTLTEAEQSLTEFINDEYENGKINETERDAFLGKSKPERANAENRQSDGEGSKKPDASDAARVSDGVKPPTEDTTETSEKPTPPEKSLTKQGRVNKLVSDQKSILKQIDLLQEQKALTEKAGKSTRQLDAKMSRLAAEYDAADAEIGELLTDETVKLPENADIEIQVGDQIRSVVAAMREGKIESREEVAAAQTKVIEILEASDLAAEDKAKFIRAIKNVQTSQQLARELPEIRERIESLSEKAAKRKLKSQIKKELKATKMTLQDGKPVSKYGPEIQKIMDFARGALKMTKDEAKLQIEKNLAAVGDEIPPPQLAVQNRILSMVSKIEEASVKELQETLDIIQSLKTTGKAAMLMKSAARAQVIDEAIDKFVSIITGGKNVGAHVRTQGAIDLDKSVSPTDWINTTFQRTIVGWDDLMDMLSFKDKESKSKKSFINQFADVLDETNAEKKGLRESMAKIRGMAQEAFKLSGRALARKLQEDTREVSLGVFRFADGSVQDLRFSRAEARKRWMEMQDLTLDETFSEPEGMAYTVQIREAIEKFLTKEDKAFAQAQLAFYQEYYTGVNEIYRDVYGVDLPKNPNYSPIKRKDIDRDKSEGFGEFLQEVRARASVTSGSLKSRTDNILTIEKRGDIAVLHQHVSEMERFKNWVNKIRDLNAVFSDSRVRAAIIENHGSGMLGTIELFIKKFTRTGSERASRINWVDGLRINYTRSVLAIKPKIALQQTIGFVAYADAMPIKDFVTGVADFWSNPAEHAKILMQSEMMKERGSDIDRDIKDAVRSDAYRSYRQGENFLNTLMMNVQLGNKGAILVGGWALYRYNRSQGMSHEEALRSFEKFTTNTQQSGDLAEQSLVQSGGSFAKLFTMFKSSQNQYLRQEIGAVRNLIAGRATLPEAAKTLAIYHFILPMLFQWVADFGEWDEENQKRAALMGSLNGLFVVGDLLERVARAIIGDKDFKTVIPIYSTGDDLVRMIKSVKEDSLTLENVMTAAGHLADAAGALTGVPLKSAVDMVDSLREISEGDYREAIGGALGWSDYALDNTDNGAGKSKRL